MRRSPRVKCREAAHGAREARPWQHSKNISSGKKQCCPQGIVQSRGCSSFLTSWLEQLVSGELRGEEKLVFSCV